MKKKAKILITTGIYPPKIGGPAQYAKNLKESFGILGHRVKVRTYGLEEKLPTGIRHIFFFFKILPAIMSSDVIIALDTFSVGFPSALSGKIFGKKVVIRSGGDFLWEQYVEKTGKKVLLKDFYKTESAGFGFKEKIIFCITSWTLQNASRLVFSTDWQKEIFEKAYKLDSSKNSTIENYYGHKEESLEIKTGKRIFVASSRKIALKNIDLLERVFENFVQNGEAELFLEQLPYDELVRKIKSSYAIINISITEVSPNLILESIRLGKPFICTKEVGIYDRIKDAGLFVNPLDKREITEKIQYLLMEEGYAEAKRMVENFNFVHTWPEIAEEFIKVFESIK